MYVKNGGIEIEDPVHALAPNNIKSIMIGGNMNKTII